MDGAETVPEGRKQVLKKSKNNYKIGHAKRERK
jgi:hypothetical protein